MAKRELHMTGGGPQKAKPLSDLEMRGAALLGKTSVQGVLTFSYYVHIT